MVALVGVRPRPVRSKEQGFPSGDRLAVAGKVSVPRRPGDTQTQPEAGMTVPSGKRCSTTARSTRRTRGRGQGRPAFPGSQLP
jgi:hypothetical protein